MTILRSDNYLTEISDAESCCEKLSISGERVTNRMQKEGMGDYWRVGTINNRSIYQMAGKEYYLSWARQSPMSLEFVWKVNLSIVFKGNDFSR